MKQIVSRIHYQGKIILIILFLTIETLITPEVFAEVLCDDLDVPPAQFVPAIAQAIRQQSKQFDTEKEVTPDEQTDERVIIKVRLCINVEDSTQICGDNEQILW